MEDDGLFLNFKTSTAPPKLSSKKLSALKGEKVKGSWRDRRAAKRAHEHIDEVPDYDPKEYTRTKPVKQVKTSSQPSIKQNESSDIPKDGIVSSLFTYNPKVEVKNDRLDEIKAEATNAPLINKEFDVHEKLLYLLNEKLKLTTPTQIQSKSVPTIRAARDRKTDVVMVAQTGSGKTLGYLLPIYNTFLNRNVTRTSGILAVILAPTRELASQIYSVCAKISQTCFNIVPGLVSGGEKRKSEKARLRKGVNILIGTPGRMADHVENTQNLDFSQVEYVVLDEGDRLIDLGFEETLTKILSRIPSSRTAVLCSATMNAQTARLKTLTLTEPITWIREEKQEEIAPGQLLQRAVIVPAKLRLVALGGLLKTLKVKQRKAIVFFSCTDSVDFHYNILQSTANMSVFKLHGNMSQSERSSCIQNYENMDEAAVLLTTDVASRGLDIVVDEVIEYDPPFAVEDHMHRVGRTARAGRSGEATIILLPSEEEYIKSLQKVHEGGVKQQSYQTVLQRGFGYSEWQDKATAWQLKIEKLILKDEHGMHDLAQRAFTAHVRAYTTHPHSERHIFNFRELHLGHLAKAFGLREAPSAMKNGKSKSSSKPEKRKSSRDVFLENAQNSMSASEFNIV